MAQIAGQAGARVDEEELRRDQMAQQQGQFEQRLKLDEFRAGAERTPDRAQQLQQEMERGGQQTQGLPPDQQKNIQEQAQKGMQTDDGYTYRPRADVLASQQAEQDRKAYEAQTKRMQARAYTEQVAQSWRKNIAAGEKEAAEKDYERLVGPLKSNIERMDRFFKGEERPADWSRIKEIVNREADPNMQPEVIEAAKNESWDPRLSKFLQGYMAKQSMDIIAETGTIPMARNGTPLVDMESPAYKRFEGLRHDYAGWMGMLTQNPIFTLIFGPMTLEEKNRMLNQGAARAVQMGLGREPDPGPMAGMEPSTLDAQAGPMQQQMPQQTQEQYDAEVGRYEPPPQNTGETLEASPGGYRNPYGFGR